MKEAHKNMGVTEGEFDAFMEDLVATLEKFNVEKAEQNEILSFLRGFQGEIVEVNSSQVGTALPPDFEPAPALPS
jgi:hemoglobin